MLSPHVTYQGCESWDFGGLAFDWWGGTGPCRSDWPNSKGSFTFHNSRVMTFLRKVTKDFFWCYFFLPRILLGKILPPTKTEKKRSRSNFIGGAWFFLKKSLQNITPQCQWLLDGGPKRFKSSPGSLPRSARNALSIQIWLEPLALSFPCGWAIYPMLHGKHLVGGIHAVRRSTEHQFTLYLFAVIYRGMFAT